MFANRTEKGQGLIEYVLVLALVGVIIFAFVTVIGSIVGGVLNDVGDAIQYNGATCASEGDHLTARLTDPEMHDAWHSACD